MLNPRQTGPGRWFTASLFQPERSVSTVPHRSLPLGQTGPGRRLPERQPRYLNSCSHDAPALSPAYPTPSLALDLGQTQQRKGCHSGLPQSGTADAYAGGTQVCCDRKPSPASAISSFDAGHTRKTMEPDGTRPQNFHLDCWGAGPARNRAETMMDQRASPTAHRVQAPDAMTHHHLPLASRQQAAHSEERGGWHPDQKQPSHQKPGPNSLHIDAPTEKQPFKATVDSCFS